MQLICPLCCDETFPSFSSLKYHLLSIAENLFCPACNSRFDDIPELVEHLDTECTKDEEPAKNEHKIVQLDKDSNIKYIKIEMLNAASEEEKLDDQTETVIKVEHADDEPNIGTSILAQALYAGKTNKPVETIVQDAEEVEETSYLCQMCNISFNSIEEHLEKYHQGEEVLIVSQNATTNISTDKNRFFRQPKTTKRTKSSYRPTPPKRRPKKCTKSTTRTPKRTQRTTSPKPLRKRKPSPNKSASTRRAAYTPAKW